MSSSEGYRRGWGFCWGEFWFGGCGRFLFPLGVWMRVRRVGVQPVLEAFLVMAREVPFSSRP
jgi:hypothetical protein